MKKMNRALTALLAAAMVLSLSVPALAVSEEMRRKYHYNFDNDPLGLFLHEDRGYASAAIAALAESYGEETEKYLVELARKGIIAIFIQSQDWYTIYAGPNYPNGPGDAPAAAEKFGVEYADVAPEAWYYDAVKEATKGGLIYGDDFEAFRPDDPITVAEFSAILCRVYNLSTGIFSGIWYGPYIDALTVAGLNFSSCRRETALEDMTRGEAIEAMTVMLRAHGGEPVRTLTWDDVEDADECVAVPEEHGWSAQALLDALNYGVIDGMNEAHRVGASSSLTRAEMCKMMQNIGITSAKSVAAYRAHEVYEQYRGR